MKKMKRKVAYLLALCLFFMYLPTESLNIYGQDKEIYAMGAERNKYG